MQALISILTLPLILLNTVGGIVALVWLAVLGEWGDIGRGIGAVIAMPILFSLASLPGVGAMFLSVWCEQRDWKLGTLAFGFVSSLWTSFLITLWCGYVLAMSLRYMDSADKWPILVWGYTVAMAPLMYMASRGAQNGFANVQTVLAQLFYVALVICWLVSAQQFTYSVFVVLMLLTFPILALFVGATAQDSSRTTRA